MGHMRRRSCAARNSAEHDAFLMARGALPMNSKIADRNRVGRRNFLQIAAAGLGAAGANGMAMAGPSEQAPNVVSQPAPANLGDDLNTADIIVDTLIAW